MSQDFDIGFARFLFLKSINVFSKKWTKVYVTIRNGIICIYSNKESKAPNHLEDLAKYSIRITPIRNKPPFWVFELLPIQEFSSMKPLKFGTSSADEMNSCLKIFQKGIELSRQISIEENQINDKNSIKSNFTLQRKLTNRNLIIDDIYENQNEIKKDKLRSESLKITGNNFEFRNSNKFINIIPNSPQNLLPDNTYYPAYDHYDNSESNKEIYDSTDDASNINLLNSNLLDSNILNNSSIYINANNDGLNIDSIHDESNNKSIIDFNTKLRFNVSENYCVSNDTENAEQEINNKNISNILQTDLKHKSISEDIRRLVEKEKQHCDLSIYASYSENSTQHKNYPFCGTIEIETEIEDKSIYDINDENNVDILNVSKLKSQEDLSMYANYNTCDKENNNDNIDCNETIEQIYSLENPQTEFQQEDLSVYADYNTSNLANNNDNIDDNETAERIYSLENPQTEFQQEDLSVYADYNTSNLANNNENKFDKCKMNSIDLEHFENNSNQTENLEILPQSEIPTVDLSLYSDFIENQSRKINFKNVLFIGSSEEAYKALSEYYLLGSFLVRVDNGKQILTVQSEEYIVKYILVYNSNSNTIGLKDQKVQFENLENLLLYYIDNNLPRRNFKLTVPYKISGNK